MYYEACACWGSFNHDSFQEIEQYKICMMAHGFIPFGPVRKLCVSPTEDICTVFRAKYKDDFKLNCISGEDVYYRKIKD